MTPFRSKATAPNTGRPPSDTLRFQALTDYVMSLLKGSEWKVLNYLLRRTDGFKKDADAVSLAQMCQGLTKRDGTVLDYGTGLHRDAAIEAVKGLESLGLVAKKACSSSRGRLANEYRIQWQTVAGLIRADASVDQNARGVILSLEAIQEKAGVWVDAFHPTPELSALLKKRRKEKTKVGNSDYPEAENPTLGGRNSRHTTAQYDNPFQVGDNRRRRHRPNPSDSPGSTTYQSAEDADDDAHSPSAPHASSVERPSRFPLNYVLPYGRMIQEWITTTSLPPLHHGPHEKHLQELAAIGTVEEFQQFLSDLARRRLKPVETAEWIVTSFGNFQEAHSEASSAQQDD